MKRLQIMVPDATYEGLQKEAKRRQATVADLVRRGIDRQLESAVNEPFRPPRIIVHDLGLPKLPPEEWREAANERADP